MVSLETYKLVQNIVGGIFLGDQILGLIFLLSSRLLGKRVEKGKVKNHNKASKATRILFYISTTLIGLSFLCFLFLYINKNVWDFANL